VKEQRDFALQVMNSMVQSIVIVSLPDGIIEFVNPATERLTQLPAQELIGRPVSDFISPELVDRLRASDSKHMRGKSHRFESVLYGVNGEKIRVVVNSAPRWKKGVVTGVIAILTDLTEQKHTEDALREARDRALDASQVKSQFLATMSHEIRTPMNAVLGMSELLLDAELGPDQKDMVAVIHESSQSLMGLLNDVLEFSKIEAHRVELDSHEFDPCAQFHATVDLFAGRAQARGLYLRRKVANNLPSGARADAEKIRRVLSNLISNAIKFTHEGGVEVTVDYELRQGDPWLKYMVRDTGVGIEPEMRSRIFEPFRQGDNSTTRKFGGTGLGLSISRELIGLMRGELDFHSDPNRETVFWFAVPVFETTASEDPLTGP
jgi:PAS domain S-box-containing protein